MGEEIEGMLEEITKFLYRWYPPEIAPLVVKKQIQMIGAVREEMNMNDVKLLLSRIQMTVLPVFMPPKDAAREVRKLKKRIGMKF